MLVEPAVLVIHLHVYANAPGGKLARLGCSRPIATIAWLICLVYIVCVAENAQAGVVGEAEVEGAGQPAVACDLLYKTTIYLFVCELPKILEKAFPVGLLLGSLFTFDKMSKDSELTIFRAVGMSFPRIVVPVVVMGFLFSLCSFLIGGPASRCTRVRRTPSVS